MIFTALLASILVCSLSASPIMVAADSSSIPEASSNEAYDDYINGVRDIGEVFFDKTISDSVTNLVGYDEYAISDNVFAVQDGYFYWCDQCYYDNGELLYWTLGISSFNSNDFSALINANVPFVIGRNGNFVYIHGAIEGISYNGPSPSFVRVSPNPFWTLSFPSSNYSVSYKPIDIIGTWCMLYVDGYNAGYRSGFDSGYSEAPNINDQYAFGNGYNRGWADGYSKGRDDGYYSGRLVGQVEGSNDVGGIMTLFSAIANIPIAVIGGFGSLAVWDIPIISILSTFLIICLFCWALKRIM